MSNYVDPKFNADKRLHEWIDIFRADMNKMNDFFNSKLSELLATKEQLFNSFLQSTRSEYRSDSG